jgi:hypothetical protein
LPGVVAETDDDIEAEIIKRASQLQQVGSLSSPYFFIKHLLTRIFYFFQSAIYHFFGISPSGIGRNGGRGGRGGGMGFVGVRNAFGSILDRAGMNGSSRRTMQIGCYIIT